MRVFKYIRKPKRRRGPRSPNKRGRRLSQRREGGLATAGERHYRFKGYYVFSDVRYSSLCRASKGSGQTIQHIKKHLKNNTGGWSFLPAERVTTQEQTIKIDWSHPEAIFDDTWR